ncbi:uncharacterized protein [Triticum aestivum]|uniref:uncharacterized protein n=1 Tax=Triticum aestivum TaxID=4565 RepID=UPI001D021A2A|nr:uncharacterized protein LOC123090292 [Triticum aestivum]
MVQIIAANNTNNKWLLLQYVAASIGATDCKAILGGGEHRIDQRIGYGDRHGSSATIGQGQGGRAAIGQGQGGRAAIGQGKGGHAAIGERRGGVGAPRGKRRNYEHYHEEAWPTLFFKVILAPKLESPPLPLDFVKHFPAVTTYSRKNTYTGCAWRVMVHVIDDMVTLDQGWAPFVTTHRVRIGYMVTLKLLTPDTLTVIVYNDDDVEVVTKCKKYDDAFAVTV